MTMIWTRSVSVWKHREHGRVVTILGFGARGDIARTKNGAEYRLVREVGGQPTSEGNSYTTWTVEAYDDGESGPYADRRAEMKRLGVY